MTIDTAIDILTERRACMECVRGNGSCEDCDNAFDMAIKALEDSRWIPVTERLPEEDGDYLVTTSSFYGTTIFVTTRNFSDGEWTYDRAVTAWMPLPTPYEGSKAK